MIKSIDAMKAIAKLSEEVLAIKSLVSVSHLQSTVELSTKCLNLAEAVLQKDTSPAICICYLTLCENISSKLKNDCGLPLLADLVLQKGVMIGQTIKKMQNM